VLTIVSGPEPRAHDRQFTVRVKIPSHEFGAEPRTAVACPLHDPAEPFRAVEADREEHLPRSCTHARDIRERDGRCHPADLPVGHPGRKIGRLMEHIGACDQQPSIAAGDDRTVILKPLWIDDRPNHFV